jgi:hypothetical protein
MEDFSMSGESGVEAIPSVDAIVAAVIDPLRKAEGVTEGGRVGCSGAGKDVMGGKVVREKTEQGIGIYGEARAARPRWANQTIAVSDCWTDRFGRRGENFAAASAVSFFSFRKVERAENFGAAVQVQVEVEAARSWIGRAAVGIRRAATRPEARPNLSHANSAVGSKRSSLLFCHAIIAFGWAYCV